VVKPPTNLRREGEDKADLEEESELMAGFGLCERRGDPFAASVPPGNVLPGIRASLHASASFHRDREMDEPDRNAHDAKTPAKYGE